MENMADYTTSCFEWDGVTWCVALGTNKRFDNEHHMIWTKVEKMDKAGARYPIRLATSAL